MLKWDPKTRVTAEEALLHPYFTVDIFHREPKEEHV
jgi:hypothetical protein